MLFHAKNGTLSLKKGTMDYIRFGTGGRVLVMLPGLGDSLRSVKGAAVPMAVMYREFARKFTVYSFSRIDPMPTGYTIRDMARDLAQAMEVLGIKRADVFGVSMGGMIAQWLAIDHPDRVERLVLAVTSAEPNPILIESIEEWMALAQAGDTTGFMRSNLRRMYSDRYCRQNMWLAPVLGRLTKPKSYDRFFIQSRACLNHNAAALLPTIRAKTLVIGGEQDKALGPEASRKIAAAIPGAELKMYPQWGHGLYEEEKTFNRTVGEFLR
jgi:pimeloyl-ACP methyl ester carboxylesterase